MTSMPKPGGVRGVLFDLYGTLLDLRVDEDQPALWQGLAEALAASGARATPAVEIRRRYQQILREEGRHIGEGFLMEPVFGRLLASCGSRLDVPTFGRLFRRLSTETLSIRPYAAPLFEALRQTSCRLAIVSNTEAVLTRVDLDSHPILQSVDTLVLSSEVGVRKPDPRIIRVALDRLHLPAASAVLVGNSPHEDIEGARRAGVRAILVDDNARCVERRDGDPVVLRVPPTLAALTRALEECGWRSPAVRRADSRRGRAPRA
ncbi:MAG: HAD family hydrolase [Vicinamibacterales bacterium]